MINVFTVYISGTQVSANLLSSTLQRTTVISNLDEKGFVKRGEKMKITSEASTNERRTESERTQ